MTITEQPINSEEAELLIQELDAELYQRYPANSVHGVNTGEFMKAGGKFFIVKIDSECVGCGALRPIDKSSVEIKRMYVRRAFRGRGISRSILNHIETLARELGYSQLMVETGDRQPEAQGLFRSNGYQQIEPFGEYVDDPHSICFEKELKNPA
jgi:putative acetyltransferase